MPSPTGTSPFRAFTFTLPQTSHSNASSNDTGSSSDGSQSSRIDRFLHDRLGRKLSIRTASRRSSFSKRFSQSQSQSEEQPEPTSFEGLEQELRETRDSLSPTRLTDDNDLTTTTISTNTSKTSPIEYFHSNFHFPVKIKPRKNILGRSIYEQLVWTLEHDPKWQSQKVLVRTIGFYKIYGEIGAGNFAKVKLGVHQLIREKVAIKIIDRTRTEPKFEKMLAREIATMDSLSHPHLIRLYEVIEIPNKIFLISEWAPAGDMYTKVTMVGRLCEHESKKFFRQVLSAITYMHANGIVHRDIKAENVFFSSATTVKVGDFGFTTIAKKGQLLTTFCGSPPYAAPELFRDASYEGPPVDIWALSVLLYFMIVGYLPFNGSSIPVLKKAILDGSFFVPDFMSVDCVDLLRSIFKQIPCRRPSITDVARHPWLRLDTANASLNTLKSSVSMNSIKSTGSSSLKDNSLVFVRRESTNLLLPTSQSTSKSLPTEEQAHSGILSLAEVQALQILHEIGIDSKTIDTHRPRGARSPVVGIYRIVLHRILEGRCWSPRDFIVPTSMSKSNSTSNLLPKNKQGFLGLKAKNSVSDEKKTCCTTPSDIKRSNKSSACSIL